MTHLIETIALLSACAIMFVSTWTTVVVHKLLGEVRELKKHLKP